MSGPGNQTFGARTFGAGHFGEPDDNTAPTVTITSGPDAVTADGISTFTFEASEEGCTFSVRIDGGPWRPSGAVFVLSVISNTHHRLEVRATDSSDNVGPIASWEWTRHVTGAPTPSTQVRIPKLAVPLRLAGSGLAVVEQDSEDEIAACVYALVATERGSRISDVDYGVEDPTFDALPLDLSEWLVQIGLYEPRAEISSSQEIEALADKVTLGVSQLGV